jgi:hypothetical protein
VALNSGARNCEFAYKIYRTESLSKIVVDSAYHQLTIKLVEGDGSLSVVCLCVMSMDAGQDVSYWRKSIFVLM